MAPARTASTPPPKNPDITDEAPPSAEEPKAAPEETGAPTIPAEAEPEPSNWQYTWGDPTQYPHIPLTAKPARPADGDASAREATVFAFATPPDNRWRPTALPVNQAADNQPPLSAKEA